jgi:hypothetical protein
MILTFWNYRKERDLIELAEYVKLSGRRNILVARDLMEEEVTFGRIRIGGQPVSKKITKRC